MVGEMVFVHICGHNSGPGLDRSDVADAGRKCVQHALMLRRTGSGIADPGI